MELSTAGQRSCQRSKPTEIGTSRGVPQLLPLVSIFTYFLQASPLQNHLSYDSRGQGRPRGAKRYCQGGPPFVAGATTPKCSQLVRQKSGISLRICNQYSYKRGVNSTGRRSGYDREIYRFEPCAPHNFMKGGGRQHDNIPGTDSLASSVGSVRNHPLANNP